MSPERCNSYHKLAGCYCVRAKGHDGLCWTRASRDAQGAMTRCEWTSENGEYKRHRQYTTTYPTNARRTER